MDLYDLIDDCLGCIFAFSDILDKLLMSMTCKKFLFLRPLLSEQYQYSKNGQFQYYVPLSIACIKGYFNIVKVFLRIHFPTISNLLDAVRGGNIELIMYLDPLIFELKLITTNYATEFLTIAAFKTSIEELPVFQYIVNRFPPINIASFFSLLGKAGNIVALEWLRSNIIYSRHFCNIKIISDTSCGAVSEEKILVLEWLLKYNYKLPHVLLYYYAARRNCKKVLEWLKEHGYNSPVRLIDSAAAVGNTELIEYLINNGYLCDESVYLSAARYDQLNVMQFLYDKGYYLSPDILIVLPTNKHEKIIQWIKEKLN